MHIGFCILVAILFSEDFFLLFLGGRILGDMIRQKGPRYVYMRGGGCIDECVLL